MNSNSSDSGCHNVIGQTSVCCTIFTILAVTAAAFLAGGDHYFYKIKNEGLLHREGRPFFFSRKLNANYADIFPEKNLVLDLMQLSNDVFYIHGHNKESKLTNQNYEFQLWVEADFSTEFMIVKSKDDIPKIIVVFRGSEEFDDWLTNTNMLNVKSKFVNAPPSVKLHRGFQRALFDSGVTDQRDPLDQSVVRTVEEAVLELVGDEGEVILTGHSLGGANAHITSVYLADKFPNMKVKMINFGAPRLGNISFKTWSENTLTNLSAWRFVYRTDIIPRFIVDTFGYRHAGHLFQMNRNDAKVYYRQRGKENVYKKAPKTWYCELNETKTFLLILINPCDILNVTIIILHHTQKLIKDVLFFAFFRQLLHYGPHKINSCFLHQISQISSVFESYQKLN